MSRINEQLRIFAGSFSNQKQNELFKEIWSEYYPRLTVFLQTSFRFKETDDPVQEIMLKVYNKLESYNPFYSFNTWIYSIARNHAVDLIKKETNIQKTVIALTAQTKTEPGYELADPETIFFKNELKAEIADFINNLNSIERQLSFLRYHESLTYKEIGKITGIPTGTAKYYIFNIKKKFKSYYGDHYED